MEVDSHLVPFCGLQFQARFVLADFLGAIRFGTVFFLLPPSSTYSNSYFQMVTEESKYRARFRSQSRGSDGFWTYNKRLLPSYCHNNSLIKFVPMNSSKVRVS